MSSWEEQLAEAPGKPAPFPPLPSWLLRLLPHKARRAYWHRHQCPASRYHARSDGWVRCQRRRHDSGFHEDAWGVEWQ